ncbi:FRP1 like and phosphatidylinositol kinase domain-containing protein [Cryptosporidium canis]|uniref:Serine/threonine-protein kinase ATR n=1 Tax=Cryptosporidium canis TaxID=195482 RepID=A0A9D5DJM2_9CRYT|nr:FRP1 like and phosphatidylinositol kinase domain-containing protein [Cryptosporidium canis]
MGDKELIDIIDTFIYTEEVNRSLDESIDSHSECIGTLRKYLLDSIREFIFGKSDTEKQIKTIKSINSSLKGICCNFGHLIFPSSGLVQFFYRLLHKIFSEEFFISHVNLETLESKDDRFNEVIFLDAGGKMVGCCISLLFTVLKLLSIENRSLLSMFIDETLISVNKFNYFLKYGHLSNKTHINFQNIDIYTSFLQLIKQKYEFVNGLGPPICISLPKANYGFVNVMGHITIQLLDSQNPFFEYSSIRDRFITIWLRILNTCISIKKYELISTIAYTIYIITIGFDQEISHQNALYLIKNKTMELIYESFINDLTLIRPNIVSSINKISTTSILGRMTIWYLNGFWRICNLGGFSFNTQSSNTYIYQTELILRYWFNQLMLVSNNYFDGYPSTVIFKILMVTPSISEIIVNNTELGLVNKLIHSNICGGVPYINIQLISLLIKLKGLRFFPNNLKCNDELTDSIIQASICGINEVYLKGNESNTLLILAHIQLVFSKYFNSNLLKHVNLTSLCYSISITMDLIRIMIEYDIGCTFEFGKYLMNHLCRILSLHDGEISNWGFIQCILLTELSIRILSKSSGEFDGIINSLMDINNLSGKTFIIIWSSIVNLLFIICLNSLEIREDLVKKIILKLLELDNLCFISSSIKIKLVKLLSIIILKKEDVGDYSTISDIQILNNCTPINKESYFPFGSSFSSISYFNWSPDDIINNRVKLLSFLPLSSICPICKEKTGSVPSKELFVCNSCWNPIPTSIDIDASTLIPEISMYFSTIDILLQFKNKQTFKVEIVDLLFQLIKNTLADTNISEHREMYSVLSVAFSYFKDKSSAQVNEMTFYLQNSVLGSNYLDYSQYQLNLFILSGKFLRNNICYSKQSRNVLLNEIIFPKPLVISHLFSELMDPESYVFEKLEDMFRLSLFFGHSVDSSLVYDKLESIKHVLFGNIFKMNELTFNTYREKIKSPELIPIKAEIRKLCDSYNQNTDLYNNAEQSHILFSIASMNIQIHNLMLFSSVLTDELFVRFFSSALTALKYAVMGIDNNWRLFWSRGTLHEFSRGIIPEKKTCESAHVFKNNSKAIYKLLSTICSVLMKQNTTLSSISISPGVDKTISLKLSSFIESKTNHPNWLISLLGPTFTYILPNLFYKSIFGYTNYSNQAFSYLKRYIPSSLSYDRLIIQIPFFLIYHMNVEDLDIQTCFDFLKSNIYSNLLKNSISDDFHLPKALVNTCIASLFWTATSSKNLLKFLLEEKDSDDQFEKYISDLTCECLKYNLNQDYIFIKQCEWLSSAINVLISELGFTKANCPMKKKRKVTKEVWRDFEIPKKIEDYIGKNLMWLLEFYSKSILIGGPVSTWSNVQLQHIYFPISFIISEPPPSNKASMYWYRIFRSLSLLLFFSRKYIKEYATRLLELLSKVTHKSNVHPSCIQCWSIYIQQLIEDFQGNIDINQNIFLQLLSPIIEQLYFIIEPHTLNKSSFLPHMEDFFEFMITSVLNINKSYFLLIPVITSLEGSSIRRIIINCYYEGKYSGKCTNLVESEYYKLIFSSLNERIDLTIKFISSHAPYITFEKLLGSIKDIILLYPIEAYWTFNEEKGAIKFERLNLLYRGCLSVISNTSNDSLILFQKSDMETDIKDQDNAKLTSRVNILEFGLKCNCLLPKTYPQRRLSNLEKSTTNLKNSISVIIGTIGAICHCAKDQFGLGINNFHIINGDSNSSTTNGSELEFQSTQISMFIKNLDILAIDLIQNHLLAYSHWNVAAFAIQEALKFIGCHDCLLHSEKNTTIWNMFQKDVQDILQPYRSTEYRIIQGTNEHLLEQLKTLSDERTENIYEFYFWCLDIINKEINNMMRVNEDKIPPLIKNINVLFEGCRVVSLGIPSVFNFILPLSIEFMILFCNHSVIRHLKEKLCSLIISGLESGVSDKLNNISMIESRKINKLKSSFIIHHVTYESIFIVITHLMEIFENVIQSKVSKILPWFNESLLEPFLQELYIGESNISNHRECEKNGITKFEEKALTPSSVTLSLLAEATKMKNSNDSTNLVSNNTGSGYQYFKNEIMNYIFKIRREVNNNEGVKSSDSKKKSQNSTQFLSALSEYPIISVLANLQFITDLPVSILIQAALSCGSHMRALLLFERFLLVKNNNEDFSKIKYRKFNKTRTSLMTQYGLATKYPGNAIDYFGTSGFNNIDFDPLNPLKFYKTCFSVYSELPNIFEEEKRKAVNHILYLPFQCYLGIKDTDNLLGIMTIYEQMSTFVHGTIDKQLIEFLLREDYFSAAKIYERIISNSTEAGLPHVVLNILLNSNQLNKTNMESENLTDWNKKDSYNQLYAINCSFFTSEALEACYQLGNWELLNLIILDKNSEEHNAHPSSYNNFYMDLFTPSNIDTIIQKFNIYRGKLLLHLYYTNYKDKKPSHILSESFGSILEKARNLLLTHLSITWNDSNSRSSFILERLHVLMDIEFVYFFSNVNINTSQPEYLKNRTNLPGWLEMSELFVSRIDHAQINIEKKYSLLSQAKIALEAAGFELPSFLLLLVLERSKISTISVNTSQSYVSFLDSFEMIGIENQLTEHDLHSCAKNTSAFGISDLSLMDLHSLNYNRRERVPGFIQLDNLISISYFEKILGKNMDNIKINWSSIENILLEEWDCNNGYIISLNQNLLVTYLFKLFRRNQNKVAVHFYEMIIKSRPNKLLDNTTLSEINLVYLDWAIKSSMVSPENIINTFQETIDLRSNCEKTYFQFANYLDSYFHLIISNSETEHNFTNTGPCKNGYNLGTIFQCDETISLCINMYLSCLKYGNSFIYPSLSRVLFLLFNYSNIILKSGVTQPSNKYENLKTPPDAFNRLKKEIMELPSSLWYVVLPQLLSRCQHPGLGSTIIQPLIARIVRRLPHQAPWSFVSMLKSNSSERKNTAICILNMSKSILDDKEEGLINEGDFTLIIDEYIRLFDNLTILAMDSSTGSNFQLQSKDQKSLNKVSNKYMSLRSDFQSIYHSMKNLNKSKGLIIPTQLQLCSYNYTNNYTKSIIFSNYLPLRNRNSSVSDDKQFLPCYIKRNQTSSISHDLITISGIEDIIFVLPSKQKPKKIGLIGSNGCTYYYLVKNEKRGDLRKDMRLMELAQLLNQRMSINGGDLSLRTFSVVPLSEVAGIIEWVPNVTTLGNIVMGEWKEVIGSSKFHRQLIETQDILRQHSMQPEKLYKLYSEDILPKYPPVLHKWFFKKFSTKSSYIWLKSKEKYTKSTAVWSMFGYIVGLGDRHAENILIDTNVGDIIHVDFDCLFGKGFLLEIPEIVPFRLTPNIVIAMGICGVEGAFTGTSISAMSILRSPFNKSLIMTFLEAFVHDPLIEWMRPGKAPQISSNVGGSADPISFLAVAKGHSHLRTIYRKLNGMVDCFSKHKKVNSTPYAPINCPQRRSFCESGLGLSVESQVLELISSAKCKRNLSQMYAGWMPQL